MQKKFTDKLIKNLKPKTYIYDLREPNSNGLAARVFPSGEVSWAFIYTYQGRKRRMTLGKYPHCSLSDARQLHRDALSVLESGKDPATEKRNEKNATLLSMTVKALIKEYIEKWAEPNKRSWKEDQRCLNKDVKPVWGNRKAKDITRRDVIVLLDKIKERGAPIQANRTLACVRRMFNFAIEQDIISSSPCIAVKAVVKENRRDRVLSIEEIKTFWLSLDSNEKLENGTPAIQMSQGTKLALKLQLVTAQRKGEIISAEWDEINLDTKWWTIPANKAKNGYAHRVPLSELAIELLTEVKKLSGESRWLFPSTDKSKPVRGESIDHAIRRTTFITEKTDDTIKKVQHFTPHDLRRTAATHMTSMGISRLVVSKILNHVESGVTAIYDRHSYDSEKKNALENWANKLKEIIEVGSEKNIIEFKRASK